MAEGGQSRDVAEEGEAEEADSGATIPPEPVPTHEGIEAPDRKLEERRRRWREERARREQASAPRTDEKAATSHGKALSRP